METNYKRTVSGSIGAGISAVFNNSDRRFFILEHKTQSAFHNLGENQKIIVDQIELGRASTCQVRFDESFDTVSRRHAAIVKDGEGWKIISLSQTNHTYVNGAPVTEMRLNNGDEIRLSSNGPVLGFIVPQGARSMVNSIGLTERMNLFRQQALRPYKTAIVVLTVLLVLGVGTLSFFNVLANKEMQRQNDIILAQQSQIEQGVNQMNNIKEEMAAKDAKILEIKQESESDKAMTAEKLADQARRIAVVSAEKRELANQYGEVRSQIKTLQDELATKEQSVYATIPDELTDDISALPEVSEKVLFSSIDECVPAIYHLSMDYISVYTYSGSLLFQLDTKTSVIGGTGFLLENGTFVTARRVVEPWFYYRSTTFGSTPGKGKRIIEWTGWRLFWAWSAGMKVVAHFTARNSEGHNFQFNSTDVSHNSDYKLNTTTEMFSRGMSVKKGQDLVALVDKYENTDYTVFVADKNDWASITEIGALQYSNGGLVSDPVYSMNPQRRDVTILGFPRNEGAQSSFEINPVEARNAINTPDLNINGLIELSTKRFVPGNDGAPVLAQMDGVWKVIGVLCHSDKDERDLAVPIANVKRK